MLANLIYIYVYIIIRIILRWLHFSLITFGFYFIKKIFQCVFYKFNNAAPNVYKIPTVLGTSKEGQIQSAPAYTITGRNKKSISLSVNFPGPGAYDAKLEGMIKKPPQYSMAARFDIPVDNMKPGPGAHSPEKVFYFCF